MGTKKVFAMGVVILVIGLLSVTYFLVAPSGQVISSLDTLVQSDTPFAMNINAEKGDVITYSVNTTANWDFYLMTQSNLEDLRANKSFSYIYRSENLTGDYTYTFTVPESSSYDFVVGKISSITIELYTFKLTRISWYHTPILVGSFSVIIVGIAVSSINKYAAQQANRKHASRAQRTRR